MEQARLIAFDLETGPVMKPGVRKAVMDAAVRKRPAQNTAKEKKLEWDTEEAREERVREALAKTAVDVLLAEPLIVCWAACHDEVDEVAVQVTDCMARGALDAVARQEEALRELAERWDAIAGPETIWLGHNIIRFDLPVLTNAWMRLGIARPKHFPEFVGGRWRGRVFDTMQRIPCGDGFVSLDNACEALGVEQARPVLWQGEEVDGSKVGAMLAARAYDDIVRYGKEDIPPLLGLYWKLTEGDTRATYDRAGGIAVQLEEVREAEGFTDGQRLLMVWSVLEGAGVVKRAA